VGYSKDLIKTILAFSPPMTSEEVKTELNRKGIRIEEGSIKRYMRDMGAKRIVETRYTLREDNMTRVAPEIKLINGDKNRERTGCKKSLSFNNIYKRNKHKCSFYPTNQPLRCRGINSVY